MAPRRIPPVPAAGDRTRARVTHRIYTGPLPVLGDPRQASREAGPAPLFLLADSQPLFRGDDGATLIDRIVAHTGPGAPRAAYVGASNDDNPDYYSIFLAAMDRLGPAECRMIPAGATAEEMAFLARADVVLLAGGDVARGWAAFARNGMRELVARRYAEGAVLVGVSAGAVQLGMAGWAEGRPDAVFPTWGLAPFVVGAHEEEREWAELRAAVRARGDGARGLGIPRAGALVVHPDGTLEAVRHPAFEVRMEDGAEVRALLVPPAPAEA